MKVVIFGATGATGREVVKQAVAAGHDVSAFARDAAATFDSEVRLYHGDVVDREAVLRAIAGHDAAVSTLGAANPFRPYPAFLEGIRNILAGVGASRARRFVYLSFIGVPESRGQFGFIGRTVIAPWLLRHPTEGHRLNEERIKASDVDWTIVRAPALTNGPRTSSYRVGEQLEPHGIVPTLSRADVAEVMVRELVDAAHVRRCVTVMH